MIYTINNFEFNSESLVLSQGADAIAIRHNEAKLLALLLKSPDKVFSKEDILTNVWHDKVVSEQAVFQNISHLRSIFGNNAIKTFPKRGYQWQLPLTLNEITEKSSLIQEQNLDNSVDVGKSVIKAPTHSISFNSPFLIVAFALIVILLSYFTISSTEEQVSSVKLSYLTNTEDNSLLTISLIDDDNFDFTELAGIGSEHFLSAIEIEYPKLKVQHPYILVVDLRTYQQQYFLDFVIRGPIAQWQGQLSGESKSEVVLNLKSHIKQKFIYQLLAEQRSPEIMLASLTIAHQTTPEDLVILSELIRNYINLNEFDKAMVMAEKLANSALSNGNVQQLGNAYLFQSEILTRIELFDLSAEKLALALTEFEKINDLKRQADVWNAQSWLDHQNKDYRAVKESLLKSAELAFQANDKPRELHALTYLSVLAHKHHQETDKYLYLRQAEEKMEQYQLPVYYFAKIPFHYAIYADNLAAKEPHLKQVLALSELTPDHWLAQNSRKQLLKYYISQNRIEDAKNILAAATTDNAQNAYLKTLLAQVNQPEEEFTRVAQTSFEKAQLAGDKTLSLDIALLLCSTPNVPVNYDFYLQYIDENATKSWRRNNEVKLLALN